jgi:hypothetical protein
MLPALGSITAGSAAVDSRGVDSGRSQCQNRVLLTADDICVKVFDYHDLQREGRSMPLWNISNTSLKIERR